MGSSIRPDDDPLLRLVQRDAARQRRAERARVAQARRSALLRDPSAGLARPDVTAAPGRPAPARPAPPRPPLSELVGREAQIPDALAAPQPPVRRPPEMRAEQPGNVSVEEGLRQQAEQRQQLRSESLRELARPWELPAALVSAPADIALTARDAFSALSAGDTDMAKLLFASLPLAALPGPNPARYGRREARQLARKLRDHILEHEGATFDVAKRAPKKTAGYLVADPAFTRSLTRDTPLQEIEDWLMQPEIRARLSQPGAHLGGWIDKSTGKMEYNVSDSFEQLGDAGRVAAERGEKAVGHLGAKGDYRGDVLTGDAIMQAQRTMPMHTGDPATDMEIDRLAREYSADPDFRRRMKAQKLDPDQEAIEKAYDEVTLHRPREQEEAEYFAEQELGPRPYPKSRPPAVLGGDPYDIQARQAESARQLGELQAQAIRDAHGGKAPRVKHAVMYDRRTGETYRGLNHEEASFKAEKAGANPRDLEAGFELVTRERIDRPTAAHLLGTPISEEMPDLGGFDPVAARERRIANMERRIRQREAPPPPPQLDLLPQNDPTRVPAVLRGADIDPERILTEGAPNIRPLERGLLPKHWQDTPRVIPDVPGGSVLQPEQVNIPRAEPRQQRTYENLQQRMQSAIRDNPLFRQDIERGVGMNMAPWYDADAIAQSAIDVLGQDEGMAAFRRWAHLMGPTSASTSPIQNVRLASYLYTQPSDVLERMAREGLAPPPGFGGQHPNAMVRSVVRAEREGLSPDANKLRSYVENILGNKQPYTLDRHEGRRIFDALGEPRVMPGSRTERKLTSLQYRAAEEAMQELARDVERSGLLPVNPGQSPTAAAQAARWGGGARETGVRGARGGYFPTLSEIFNRSVYRTARRTGLEPDEVLRRFWTRQMPLLGVGGLLLGGAAMGDAPEREQY